MKQRAGGYEVDDNPARVDLDAAVAFLTTEAYWGRWRSGPDIKEQISQAVRVVGAYDRDGAMVGLARAAGDGGTLYLADVYVQSGHRGAGLGKALIRLMVDDGPYAGRRWMLHTSDAHGLYREFGFTAPDSRYLERAASAEPVPDPLDTGMLTGQTVRLEPLGYRHIPGLLAARADGGELYKWMPLPRTTEQARRWVETALETRDKRTAVPYAVVRIADGAVIGSTRFHQLDFWPWPDAAHPQSPDVCEIGWTWLSLRVIRTGVNTENKRLMLTHAFETWGVRSVCFHADSRNERSRAALERIGARFEGILRAHRLASDLIPRDSARYSITAAEWPAVQQHLADLSRRLRYEVTVAGDGRGLGAGGRAELGTYSPASQFDPLTARMWRNVRPGWTLLAYSAGRCSSDAGSLWPGLRAMRILLPNSRRTHRAQAHGPDFALRRYTARPDKSGYYGAGRVPRERRAAAARARAPGPPASGCRARAASSN